MHATFSQQRVGVLSTRVLHDRISEVRILHLLPAVTASRTRRRAGRGREKTAAGAPERVPRQLQCHRGSAHFA